MNNRTRLSTVVLAAVLVGGGAAAPANAGVQADCDSQFSALSNATDAAWYKAARDEAGLLGKVDDAKTKYSQHKVSGSVQKLEDYKSKVTTLLASKKMATNDDLIALADLTIACVT